nr:DNA-binding protein [Megamonas hypermegale]
MEQAGNFITAKEVAIYCGVSVSKAYDIIRQLNTQLKRQGKITIAGRVNRQYFLSKI